MDERDYRSEIKAAQMIDQERQKSEDFARSRDVSRRAILTIITLSSTIVAATFAFYSISSTDYQINPVAIEWIRIVFVSAITSGILYLLIDGRLLHFETWEEAYTKGGACPADKELRKIALKYTLLSMLWPDYRNTGYSQVIALQLEKNPDDYSMVVGFFLRRIRSWVLMFEFVVYLVFVIGMILLATGEAVVSR